MIFFSAPAHVKNSHVLFLILPLLQVQNLLCSGRSVQGEDEEEKKKYGELVH